MHAPHVKNIHIKKGGAISKSHSRWPLILIGVSKLVKAAALVFVFHVAKLLLDPKQHAALAATLDAWRLDPGNHHLHWLLEKVLAIDPQHLRLLRVGTIIYAVLFVIEGVGLLLDFAWAEWLLVVTTGLLVPVEIWEVAHQPSAGRVVVFVLNVAILVYVCYRLKWRLQDRRAGKHA
jgi:uncharacterized membrane protein (DUF2068 family)